VRSECKCQALRGQDEKGEGEKPEQPVARLFSEAQEEQAYDQVAYHQGSGCVCGEAVDGKRRSITILVFAPGVAPLNDTLVRFLNSFLHYAYAMLTKPLGIPSTMKRSLFVLHIRFRLVKSNTLVRSSMAQPEYSRRNARPYWPRSPNLSATATPTCEMSGK
jgi:hypothetical protein